MGYAPPNYTQTPNLFLDEHLPDMGYAETKVVLAIIRKTFGWHKEKDRISVSQFEKLTGLSRQGVQNGIHDALERGVIGREECGLSYTYFLVVNEVERSTDQNACNQVERSVQPDRTEVCKQVDTQKKGKKHSSKESAPESPPAENEDPTPDEPRDAKAVWHDVTGETMNHATAQTLRDAFERRRLPWKPHIFAAALRTAYENVGRTPRRIRAGYLMDSYAKRLDREAPAKPSASTEWRD